MSSPVGPKYGLAPILTPLIAIGALLVLSWPLLLHPTRLLANGVGEGNNHYWMLWRAFQSGPVSNLPQGVPIPIMDPVNLVWAAPWMWSPALAFNAVIVANMLLAFAGAWALAWVLELDWRACIVAGLACMSAPFLWGVVSFGITESLPVGWLALGVAALIRHGQQGLHRWWVLAGVCIGAFGLSGWYHAAFAVPVLLLVGPWLAWRYRRPLGLLGAAGIVLAMCLPALVDFLAVREFWSPRWRNPAHAPPPFYPDWRSMPHRGADLINFFLPSLERIAVSKSVYLGVVTVGLAALAGKKARIWLGVLMLMFVLALGFWLKIAGQTAFGGVQLRLPAGGLTDLLPALEGITHWHRAIGPAIPFLALSAAFGAARLMKRWERVWIPISVALVLESVLLSQTPWPRDLTPVQVPNVLADLPAGALAILPFDNAPISGQTELPRRYNLWQPGLNRPITENYEGADAALSISSLLSAGNALCRVPGGDHSRDLYPKELRVPERAIADGGAGLEKLGVRYVSLHRDLCPGFSDAHALIQQVLGPPMLEQEGIAVWEVE